MLLRKLIGVLVYMCLKILSVSCEDGSTLAFAIDDTRSMWDDITQVKKEANAIMNVVLTEKSSQIKDFVLVTINDPDVVLRTKTNSTKTFQRDLHLIRVHNYGNIDCEEMSMTGIKKALLYSRPGSYVYVFTDASAKDYYIVESVKSLCQKKQSQVVFVLTGDCGNPSDRMYTVYYEVAAACGGQVFRVKKEQVDEVLQTIKILLKGKNPAIEWKMVPQTDKFVPVPFTIDEKADYAMVSTSGKDVFLRISTINNPYGPNPKTEKIMWNENSKVVGLIDPLPGTYYAFVKGSSVISVVVYARTDFTFQHGFSVLEPKSMKDTSKQPIAGKKQHLSVNITDPDQSVNIKLAQILDLTDDNHVIMELPLRKTYENFYITEPFVSPTSMFKIAIKGETKKTGKPIRRISTTAVVPVIPIVVIPETVPSVKIDGVNLDVNYGSEITLTCRVSAHPAPKIEWLKSDNLTLPSESSIVEDTSYISYLMLKNIKQNETYVCKATNKKGFGESKSRIGVRPIFNAVSIPARITPAIYKEDVKIPCKIKSDLPIKIRWFRLGKELSNSGVISISPNGSELTLKSMELGMEGNYTCEASLNSDPTVKQTYSTAVAITGLVLPIIETSDKKIHVMKRDKIELKCKIVEGHPRPQLQWFKKDGDQFKLLPLVTSETLTVPLALFSHAGHYKCIAENVKGNASAEFEVTMSSLPEITIGETRRVFSYGSNVEFTCKTESQPPSTIEWKDKNGSILQNKTTQISKYEFANKLKLENIKKSDVYTCVASNEVGSTIEYVNITVPSPFKVEENIQGDLKIQYGLEKTLRCDIKSSKRMKIQWYRQTIDVKSSRSQIHSNDKFTVSDDGIELKIKFMDTDMDGKYTCEASLLSEPEEKLVFSNNIKTVGLIGPEIVYSTSILNEKNFTAICRVKGVPKPTISWQFQPKGSKDFTSVAGSGEELNIPELKLKHSGAYKCVVKNRLGEKHREINVVVKERPVITTDKLNYFGVEGDSLLKIPCNVTGFPDPTIVWKKEGVDIKKDDPKYVIKGTALYIKSPMKSDSANFTCLATNELGMSSVTVETTIVDNFQNDGNFYGETHNVYAVQEKPVAIKCNIISSETRSVRWYRNGQKTNQTGNAFVIENPSMFDDGNYTCRIDTDEGSKTENYVLDIGFSPTFKDDGPSSIDVTWLEDETLDCTANSKPEEKYEWFHDGKKIESENYKTHHVSDWGEYTCNVSNVHGSIQKTFKITSPGCYLTKNMGTQNKPLITDVDRKWPFLMSNSDVLLKKNEEIKLSCPSDKKSTNVFQMIPSKKEIVAKCNTQDKFTVDGKTYRYSELQCMTTVEPILLNEHEQCLGPNSEMIQVGFEADKFLETYKICYDSKLKVPLYGSASKSVTKIKNGANPSEFKWSPVLEVGGDKPTGGYTCKTSVKCCYKKEQLVNFNELPFGPAQVAMFKENLNSISVWNPCDRSGRTSWQEFERELRDMSGTYDTWSSWTGASDYATKNGGLVPRYLWKVMTYEHASSVMVYVNDESPVPSDIRCTKSCESMKESSDKYLYCCTVEEFSEVFGVPANKLITH